MARSTQGAHLHTTTAWPELMFSLSSPQEERAGESRPLLSNAPLPTRASRGEGENFWRLYQDAPAAAGVSPAALLCWPAKSTILIPHAHSRRAASPVALLVRPPGRPFTAHRPVAPGASLPNFDPQLLIANSAVAAFPELAARPLQQLPRAARLS